LSGFPRNEVLEVAADDRQTDTSLIRLLRESRSTDPERWKQCLARFYEQYLPVVIGWCRARGLDEPDALDLAHDLMLDIGRRIKRFDFAPGKRFSDWLFIVTRNAVFDRGKREARWRTADSAVFDLAAESGDLVERLTAAFEREVKLAALAHVERHTDEINRQIIELRFRQSLSGGEVAERLGIQPAALYQRVRRLRKELDRVRQQFEAEGPMFLPEDGA
jgi:RNA polymerase sigma factor (sigma-70 family)